jgi:hypothetical protein
MYVLLAQLPSLERLLANAGLKHLNDTRLQSINREKHQNYHGPCKIVILSLLAYFYRFFLRLKKITDKFLRVQVLKPKGFREKFCRCKPNNF